MLATDMHSHKANQYSEINVMHFLFSLLRIKDLYMFRSSSGGTTQATLCMLRACYVSGYTILV
jgi:hypothetical protein